MTPKESHIVLFDGHCNLCNGLVQFIIKRDPTAKFKFAALQSNVGKQMLQDVGFAKENLGTIVFIQGSEAYVRSDAALRIAKALGGAWSLVYVLRVVPRRFRDAVYAFVAERRYRWFGRQDSCMVPTADTARRFIQDK